MPHYCICMPMFLIHAGNHLGKRLALHLCAFDQTFYVGGKLNVSAYEEQVDQLTKNTFSIEKDLQHGWRQMWSPKVDMVHSNRRHVE